MSRVSAPTPFRDGFAALGHEPALLAAELAWRWCFGFSALVLGVVSIGLYLDSLKVSRADQFLLGTVQPQLLAEALRHIFRGSLSRFLLEQAALILGLTLLWSFASAVGRAATLRRLVAMFSSSDEPEATEWHFRSIFLLQLMRAMWTQIALAVGIVLFLYGSAMAGRERPFAAALSISFGVGFAALVGFYLNWYLGIAPLFCIRNGVGARDAVDQALSFSAAHSGRLLLMGVGFFVLRLVWAGTMWLVLLAPLSLEGKINDRWIGLLMAMIVLVYFAGADLLKLARWGSYVSLAYEDSRPASVEEVPSQTVQPSEMLPLEGLA
jgi:hypothetical protein